VWLFAAKRGFSTLFLAVFWGLFWVWFGGSAAFWGYLFTLIYRRVMRLCWWMQFVAAVGGFGELRGEVCA